MADLANHILLNGRTNFHLRRGRKPVKSNSTTGQASGGCLKKDFEGYLSVIALVLMRDALQSSTVVQSNVEARFRAHQSLATKASSCYSSVLVPRGGGVSQSVQSRLTYLGKSGVIRDLNYAASTKNL